MYIKTTRAFLLLATALELLKISMLPLSFLVYFSQSTMLHRTMYVLVLSSFTVHLTGSIATGDAK
jgi:hypothetical protein